MSDAFLMVHGALFIVPDDSARAAAAFQLALHGVPKH